MVQCSVTDKSEGREGIFDLENIPLKFEESVKSQKDKENLRKYALILCFASVIINFTLCVVGFVFASIRNSPATFAFAADCVLDLLSSVVVIWRYFGSPYTAYSTIRENNACVSLGALFTVAGTGVIIQAIVFISLENKPKWFTVLIVLAIVGVVTCIILGTLKVILYVYIRNKSLFLDGLNSYLSAAFALVIIIGDVVYFYDNRVWFLDPLLSIVFSLGLLAYGFQIIIIHSRSQEEKTIRV